MTTDDDDLWDIACLGGSELPDRAVDDTPAELTIEAACAIDGRCVAFLAWVSDPGGQVSGIRAQHAGGADQDLLSDASILRSAAICLAPRARPGQHVSFAMVGRIDAPRPGTPAQITLRSQGGYGQSQLQPEPVDVPAFARLLKRAPFDFQLRALVALHAGLPPADETRSPLAALDLLAAELHAGLDADEDHGAASRDDLACYVDQAIGVPTVGLVVKGWLLQDGADRVARMSVREMTGRTVPLRLPLPRLSRRDVLQALEPRFPGHHADCGFVALVPMADIQERDPGRFLELQTEAGVIRRVPLRSTFAADPRRGVQAVVQLAELSAVDLSHLFEEAIAAPIDALWAGARAQKPEPTERTFGRPAPEPQVSVIVPLYGRCDFVRHQIASFSNDPDFRSPGELAELIYVLDDPRIEADARRLCELLHAPYGVPFRLVSLHGNFGYSSANNAGARLARGRLLLLLNSDVMPTRARWLSQLVRAYDTLESCGALGCRLLFPDGSIQHAGMQFRPSRHIAGCWTNEHPGKGLPPSLDPCREPTEAPAVTGACLMVDRSLYERLGGLSEDYVIGDFEDSDLCLAVREQGLRVYYVPTVELYHLERQSMQLVGDGNAAWRQSLTLFNMWRHARRWEHRLGAASDPADAASAA